MNTAASQTPYSWPAFVQLEIDNCIRCGFCLPVCPTYKQTALETASPRGRIALLRAVVADELEIGALEDQFSLCLGCRACETACPAGVAYGRLFEQGRAAVHTHGERPAQGERPAPDSPTTLQRLKALAARRQGPGHWLETLAIRHLFPSPRLLRLAGHLLWFYQVSGLAPLLRRVGFFGLLPDHLVEMEAILPRVPAPWARRSARDATATASPALGPRAVVFTGCIQDVVFSETNYNTGRLVAAAGAQLMDVPAQACCGALHAHTGDLAGARRLARRNIAAFDDASVDVIVTNAGGCGAQLLEYPHLLEDDPAWAERARTLAHKVQDISAFLVEQGYDPTGSAAPASSEGRRVTYQDSCHLVNGQKVKNEPRQLLRALPDLEYREQVAADQCCGSAGIYNIVEPEMSGRILHDKMENVKDTQAGLVATANPGCLLQMRLGIQRAGLAGKVQAIHIVDLLAASLPDSPSDPFGEVNDPE